MLFSLLIFTAIFLNAHCTTPVACCNFACVGPCNEKYVPYDITITYEATLTCKIPRFCAQMYYKEHNLVESHGNYDFVPLHCTNGNELHHQIEIAFSKYGAILGSYEPYLEIYEDCGGEVTRRGYDLPKVYRRDDNSNVNYTINLSNPEGWLLEKRFSIDRALQSEKFENSELKERTLDWLAGGNSSLKVFNLLTSNETNEAFNSTDFPYSRNESNLIHETIFVNYNTTLTCESEDPFCVMAYYTEHDYLSSNDDLGFIPVQCSTTGSINYQIIVNFTGGDADRKEKMEYEPMIEIYHDCGERIRGTEHRLPSIPMNKRFASFNFTVNIHDSGDIVHSDYQKRQAFRAKELQKPKLRQKTFEWLFGETSAFEVIDFLKSNGTDESAAVPDESDAVHTNITVTYNGTLKCNSGKRFCAILYYVEHDYMSSNDDLDNVPLDCSETGILNHTISFNITGGDSLILKDHEYEPMVEIYHDCGGQIRLHKVLLPEIRMDTSRISFNYTKSILNQGFKMDRHLTSTVLRAEILKKNPELKEKSMKWFMGDLYPAIDSETLALQNESQKSN